MDILPKHRLRRELDALLPDLQLWHASMNGEQVETALDDEVAARVPAVMARLVPVFAELKARGIDLPECPKLSEDNLGWVNVVVPFLVSTRNSLGIGGRLRSWLGDKLKDASELLLVGNDPLGSIARSREALAATYAVPALPAPAADTRSGLTREQVLAQCGAPEEFDQCVRKIGLWFAAADNMITFSQFSGPIDLMKEPPLIIDVLDLYVKPELVNRGFKLPDAPEYSIDPIGWHREWAAYFWTRHQFVFPGDQIETEAAWAELSSRH